MKLGILGGVRVVFENKEEGKLALQEVVLKVGAYSRELLELMTALSEGQELEVSLKSITPPLPLRWKDEGKVARGVGPDEPPY